LPGRWAGSYILNATPLFAILVMAACGELAARRVVGVLGGLVGVIILRGQVLEFAGGQTLGMLLCPGGALSYGFSGLWGRRKLAGVPPLTRQPAS
jgi:drug/metabolite transporter (DMT)-like permease